MSYLQPLHVPVTLVFPTHHTPLQSSFPIILSQTRLSAVNQWHIVNKWTTAGSECTTCWQSQTHVTKHPGTQTLCFWNHRGRHLSSVALASRAAPASPPPPRNSHTACKAIRIFPSNTSMQTTLTKSCQPIIQKQGICLCFINCTTGRGYEVLAGASWDGSPRHV